MRVLFALFALLSVTLVTFAASAKSARVSASKDPERLELPSGMPEAFFFRPKVRGSRPVLMFLHGRGGNPQEDCRKWAPVATQFGWLVCPLMLAMAASAAFTPASAAFKIDAAFSPLVSCVWKWIGIPTSWRSAFTSRSAA